MPFRSKAQARLCWALQRRSPRSSWNCSEWARHTKSMKALPERAKLNRRVKRRSTKKSQKR